MSFGCVSVVCETKYDPCQAESLGLAEPGKIISHSWPTDGARFQWNSLKPENTETDR